MNHVYSKSQQKHILGRAAPSQSPDRGGGAALSSVCADDPVVDIYPLGCSNSDLPIPRFSWLLSMLLGFSFSGSVLYTRGPHTTVTVILTYQIIISPGLGSDQALELNAPEKATSESACTHF